MDVVSVCPLRVGSLVWHSADGWRLTVVCKATYLLAPGVCPFAPAQEPPLAHDVHHRDDPDASLLAARDLVPFKRRPEVLVLGSAFSPGGRPAQSIHPRITIGAVDKALVAFCDRAIRYDGELVFGPWVTEVPLVWERAAGGSDSSNPVGVPAGFADRYGNTPLPNLQPTGTLAFERGQIIEPIGLSPIAPDWPPRADKLGPHRALFAAEDWAPRELPADLDSSFFNAAPADQQLEHLAADEPFALDSLHRGHPSLTTRLPGVTPEALLTRRGRPAQALALVADTLCIDTDAARCTLVWRGGAAIAVPAEQGVVMVSLAGGSEGRQDDTTPTLDRVRLPDTQRLPLPAQPQTLAGTFNRGVPELPFVSGPSAPPEPETRRPALCGQTIDASLPHAPLDPAKAEAPPIEPYPSERVSPPPRLGAPLPNDATPVATVQPAEEVPPTEPQPAAPRQPPTPADFPVADCAAIAASIAMRPLDSAQIIGERGLTPGQWAALHAHWRGRIRGESDRGKSALRRSYDRAYLEQVERERGPITVDEYARLAVASERGTAAAALAELRLPAAAHMRLERIWFDRTTADAELGERTQAAIAAAREA